MSFVSIDAFLKEKNINIRTLYRTIYIYIYIKFWKISKAVVFIMNGEKTDITDITYHIRICIQLRIYDII